MTVVILRVLLTWSKMVHVMSYKQIKKPLFLAYGSCIAEPCVEVRRYTAVSALHGFDVRR